MTGALVVRVWTALASWAAWSWSGSSVLPSPALASWPSAWSWPWLWPWPAFASLAAGAGSFGLLAYLWRYRGKPGADWFLLSLGFQTLWGVAYGAALFVFAPRLRWLLEVVVWVGIAGTGIYFLAFALAYTGRGHVVRSWWFRGLLVAPGPIAALVATNSLHRLAWTNYHVDPTAGMAVADYVIQPWALVGMTAGIGFVLVGTLLLFDTVVSYGPLYRREAVAVGLSTIPVVAAFLVWLYGLGPVPELNFATVMFLPHVALDAYAFVGSDMFEFHPATRRAGERAAIDDLGTPVVIVDEQGRVVTLNDAALDAFDLDRSAALTRPLADLLGTELDPEDPRERLELARDGQRRVYAVAVTPLEDAAGTHVGYTVVLQDVTAERRREQRLDVLNRVLRHNLRNDMDVVRGFADAAAEEADDPTVGDYVQRIGSTADDLLALGRKARDVERMLDRDGAVETVDVAALIDQVVDACAEDGAVAVDCPDLTVRTDPDVLEIVLETLVENAVEHADSRVTVTAARTDGGLAIEVGDDGPGVPDHELAVLDAGAESALEHGSGLGLWLANWGTTALGGDLSFETGEDGTTARVELPE